jgi:flagellar basal body-associated protein FliL
MRKMKELFLILIFVLVILLIISSFGGSFTFSTPDHVVIINEPSENDDYKEKSEDNCHSPSPSSPPLPPPTRHEHPTQPKVDAPQNVEGMDDVIPFFNQNKVFAQL